jgi:ribosome maturation factor RimP
MLLVEISKFPNPKSDSYRIQNTPQVRSQFGRYTLLPYLCRGNRLKEGNDDRSLLLLSEMSMDGQIQALEQRIQKLIEPETDVFLVEIRIKPTNNVKVFLDADHGMSIDRLIQYNRKLYKEIEEEGFFPNGDFSLEVSSPGLDEPLKLHRQYLKNTGRFVEVLLNDGAKREGKLINVSDETIVVEEEKGKGKKKELLQHVIPFVNIKTTKIQIKF